MQSEISRREFVEIGKQATARLLGVGIGATAAEPIVNGLAHSNLRRRISFKGLRDTSLWGATLFGVYTAITASDRPNTKNGELNPQTLTREVIFPPNT